MKKKVVVIVGPTAVGKTKISIEVAKRINGEIISADSMQIYKYMNIGTAKPTAVEMQGIPHHLMDIIEPCEEYSVARYKEMALECIEKIITNDKIPIIVGGTGLYVNSIIENIEFTETVTDWTYREELQKRAERDGIDILYQELRKVDEEASKKINSNDLRRIIRALEVFKFTGKPISYHQKISKLKEPLYDFIIFGLTTERQTLYDRINNRVDKMFEEGLVDEVKSMINMGINMNCTAMQGLGYKETVEYLNGFKSFEEIVEIIKRDTRRYAKRQLTWFRRNNNIKWIEIEQNIEEAVKKLLLSLDEVLTFM